MGEIERLLQGFRRFREHRFERQSGEFRRLVEEGQKPRTLVIGCSDSRVDPAILFDCGPGELFMVRNVANLVPTYVPEEPYRGTSAALEYGVRDLLVEQVIVLGHAYCGGIRAALDTLAGRPPERDFIGAWIAQAHDACELAAAAHDGDTNRPGCGATAEKHSIVQSLANLRTFPWIRERVESGDLQLHGWWFDLDRGVLEAAQADGTFVPIAP